MNAGQKKKHKRIIKKLMRAKALKILDYTTMQMKVVTDFKRL